MCLETKNGKKIKFVSWKQHKEDMNTFKSQVWLLAKWCCTLKRQTQP